MARIPMKGDPPSLNDVFATYGDPLDHMLAIHADTKRRLAEAEADDNSEMVAECRQILRQTQKLIDDYGLPA